MPFQPSVKNFKSKQETAHEIHCIIYVLLPMLERLCGLIVSTKNSISFGINTVSIFVVLKLTVIIDQTSYPLDFVGH